MAVVTTFDVVVVDELEALLRLRVYGVDTRLLCTL